MPKKRRNKVKALKSRLHVFCEGTRTEPNYFNGYIEMKFAGSRLVCVEKSVKNDPVKLVQVAVKAKAENPAGDIFWVVYDRESVNEESNNKHDQAHQLAQSHDINIAISNVCFEVWLLLHFQKTAAAYSNYTDLIKRSRLTRHIKGYEKGAKISFSSLQMCEARKNAKTINSQTKMAAEPSWTKPYQWNPYTNVYQLLDAIDAFMSVC